MIFLQQGEDIRSELAFELIINVALSYTVGSNTWDLSYNHKHMYKSRYQVLINVTTAILISTTGYL